LGVAVQTPAAVRQPLREGFIVGPAYDGFFFILAPLVAVLFSMVVAAGLLPSPVPGQVGVEADKRFWAFVVFAVFTEGHLVLAFFRSHLNSRVFHQHPLRFTLVPLVVFAAGACSPQVLATMVVVAVWWDVYHSGMQTFGFGRIYDARAGNDASTGRQLDLWLNLVIYAGPILAGATLMAHVVHFDKLADVGVAAFGHVPVFVESKAGLLSRTVAAASLSFIAYYVYRNWEMHRQGYRVSPQKVALLVTTALTSVYAWYFNSFGMGFVVANLFHAVQYLGIIYWQERGNLAGRLHVDGSRFAATFVCLALAAVAVGFGFFAASVDRSFDAPLWPWSLAVTVALMHFWYDGFIWSVRKREVGS